MSTIHRLTELSLEQARAESRAVSLNLVAMAKQSEAMQISQPVMISRYWNAAVGTYTYHTHAQALNVDKGTFQKIVDCFFHAASLPYQPWYAQFLTGTSAATTAVDGANRAAVVRPVFDFGLGKKHGYCQLLTEFSFSESEFALVLRSVKDAVGFPAGTTPAFTLSPTGDVFRWHGNTLHWHHICTVAGVGLLPPTPERYLMNSLRWLGLDQQERKTYREEAELFISWAQNADAVHATWLALSSSSEKKSENADIKSA